MKVGTQIAEARKAKGLSQEALARQLGVAMMTVSRWERNNVTPPLMRLQEIASALDVSVAELLVDGACVDGAVDGATA